MSDAPGQGGRAAMPKGQPFVKGDPRINKGGPVSAKLRKLQKRLLKMSDLAIEKLEEGIREGSVEHLKLWARYTIPVPKAEETKPNDDPYRKMSDAELWAHIKKASDEREAMQ